MVVAVFHNPTVGAPGSSGDEVQDSELAEMFLQRVAEQFFANHGHAASRIKPADPRAGASAADAVDAQVSLVTS